MNEIFNIVTGDNSDAVVDLGYEKNFHNWLSDYDNESLFISIVPTLSEEFAIPMIADDGAVDHIPKNSSQCVHPIPRRHFLLGGLNFLPIFLKMGRAWLDLNF